MNEYIIVPEENLARGKPPFLHKNQGAEKVLPLLIKPFPNMKLKSIMK